MHIITTTSQDVIFIPRRIQNKYDIDIYNEQTRETTTAVVNATIVLNGNYSRITLPITPAEGDWYSIEMTDGTDLIYRGKVFCTDQVNLNKYTTQSATWDPYAGNTNEYILTNA